MQVLLTAEELLSCCAHAGVSVARLCSAVMQCTPVNAGGKRTHWPPSYRLRVKDLMIQRVQSPMWPAEPAVPGLNVMGTVIAEKAAHLAIYQRRAQDAKMEMTEPQVEEIIRAAGAFLEPHGELLVSEVFVRRPEPNGFFDVAKWDSARTAMRRLKLANGCSTAFKRLLAETFEGLDLQVWRMAHAPEAQENVVDVHAALFDADGVVSYLHLRRVQVSPGTRASELVAILDCYDAQGLALGVALKDCEDKRVGRRVFEQGQALVHVTHAEVRQDYRGNGLGARFLHKVLGAVFSRPRMRPALLSVSLHPAQYDAPFPAMPSELLLHAWDCVDRMHSWIETQRPQSALVHLNNEPLVYLPPNGLGRAASFEQLLALAENARL